MPSTHDRPVPVRSAYLLKPDTGKERRTEVKLLQELQYDNFEQILMKR